MTTNIAGTVTASRTYRAYGTTRSSSGVLPTDRTFTNQKQDGTGLLYYNARYARYYDPTRGTFISPDTLVPDAGVLFDYNRFMYVRGNPLKYTDPSGHFSEEQLNWMGIFQDKVSTNVWELLLKLEPTDRIYGDGLLLAEVGIKAHLDDTTWYELTLNIGGKRTNAVDWLSSRDSYLSTASISRQVGAGYAEVWKNGKLIAPEYHHSLGQSGFIQGKWGAFHRRLPGLFGKEGLAWGIGERMGPFVAGFFGIASDAIGTACPGCEEGDISMSFVYPHHDNGAYQPTARNIWYRLDRREGMLIIDQTWIHDPGRPTPYIGDNSWGTTP